MKVCTPIVVIDFDVAFYCKLTNFRWFQFVGNEAFIYIAIVL